MVTILPNDNPYGVVMFSQQSVFVNEELNDTYVLLSLRRSGGLFGTLKVYYRYLVG